MNDLEQRVTDYLLMGTGGSSLELLRELTIEHLELKESTRKVMSATMDSHNRILGELKAAKHELIKRDIATEKAAIEADKVSWWGKWG